MRVLVVEDDPKIAGFIADGLRQEGHDAQVVADGEAGLGVALKAALAFDAIVLDLMLPKLDGFGVMNEMRRRKVKVPVLMLSALDSVDDRVRGLRAGADDYLVKPFAFDELTARLRALVRRGENVEPTRLSADNLTLDRLTRRVRRGNAAIDLQPKEFALLEYFLCHAGQTLTRTMILEHVWDWTFDPQTNIVDVLVRRLRNKIERAGEAKLIHTLRGIGYVLRVE